MKQKWNDLFALMGEASRFKSRSTFATGSRRAYEAAKKLDLLDALFPAKQWTIYECVEEAVKHDSRSCFRRASPDAFAALERNGMLDYFFLRYKHRKTETDPSRLIPFGDAEIDYHAKNWK